MKSSFMAVAILALLSATCLAVVVEPSRGYNGWGVADDWRLTNDWNRDGVIDWRDDFWLSGERPWTGDWARADWNRDGIIDWQDGWRRLDDTWTVGAVNGVLPAGAWKAEGSVVREVPATGIYDEWRGIDGPWTTPGWGAGWEGYNGWNGWNDGWATGVNGWNNGWNGWNNGWNGVAPRTEVVVDDWALRGAAPAWRGDVAYNDWAWRDGLVGDWDRPVRRAAPATTTTKTTTKPTTTTAKTAAKTTTKTPAKTATKKR